MSALAAPQAPIKSGSIRMGSVPNNLFRSVRRGTAGSDSWGPVASPAEAATMKARANNHGVALLLAQRSHPPLLMLAEPLLAAVSEAVILSIRTHR